MAGSSIGREGRLKILHVLRAPLGGLFRHVVDLTREQVRRGHAVGLIADSTTGGEAAAAVLGELAPSLALGLTRVPMRRDPHASDLAVMAHVLGRVREVCPDVVHGHGSKGGAFARLQGFVPGLPSTVRAYTPHGGSLNHRPGSAGHRLYMMAERLLATRTDLLLFESAFISARYEHLVGRPRSLVRVVPNGIGPDEFAPVTPGPDAAEFLYVGELRAAKGIDLFLAALAEAGRHLGTEVRAVLVGSGPDEALLTAEARRLRLEGRVRFAGAMPARRAFELGRILVVPSRAESLPYIALEAAAARVPLIATDVGGIPEIFGPFRGRLVPPNDVPRLTARMVDTLAAPPPVRNADAVALAGYVRDRFSLDAMVGGVIEAYRDARALKSGASRRAQPPVAIHP